MSPKGFSKFKGFSGHAAPDESQPAGFVSGHAFPGSPKGGFSDSGWGHRSPSPGWLDSCKKALSESKCLAR